jgi:hypothetical protein
VSGGICSSKFCPGCFRAELMARSDALNLLTSTRQSFLLQSFIEALTRGGPNGLPRPIELHAHDPTRYVGDMLAWVHQATAGEREFLDSLFGVTSHRRRMVGEARDMSGEASEEEVLARGCLDKALEGLARPLKVRCAKGCRWRC